MLNQFYLYGMLPELVRMDASLPRRWPGALQVLIDSPVLIDSGDECIRVVADGKVLDEKHFDGPNAPLQMQAYRADWLTVLASAGCQVQADPAAAPA